MTMLEDRIAALWERRDQLTPEAPQADRDVVEAALELLDRGEERVAMRDAAGVWRTAAWLKQAVLLSFRLSPMGKIGAGAIGADPSPGPWWDKVPTKFAFWSESAFREAGIRVVPGAVVRRSAYVSPGAVLMPCFINMGAHVGARTMVDTWSTIGSCAQIGADCHISGGVGIGGVLEPLQAAPVIIEDNVFIGARSEVAEGVVVREGAVLAMGVYLGASTKIVDRASGAVSMGEVPPYSVLVPGSLPDPKGGPSLYCAVIVKRVDAQTRAKTAVNALLRD